jgi:hypothetical protein
MVLQQCWYTLVVLVLLICENIAQDYSIYGLIENAVIPINARKRNEIYGKCFSGLGLTQCSPNLPEDDVVLNYDLLYLQDLASIKGQFYCLQCCGTSPWYTDTWDLSCPVEPENLAATNVYGTELRLARKATLLDSEIVSCPLKRTACNYDNGPSSPVCNRTNDNTFLHGYTLTIEVSQYDSNFAFWKGVTKCEFTDVIERNYSLVENAIFTEKIILKYRPIDTFAASDGGKIAIIVVTLLVLIYGALYFLRRKRCEYCQQKLVFSRRLCYKCVLVGAQPPDPVLMKALEERGLHMQGKMPERFGFVQRTCVAILRCCYNCTTCQCCCSCCAWSCRTCCCCCKCCHCCEPKPPPRIVPDNIEEVSLTDIEKMEAALVMERDAVEAFDEPVPETVTTEPSGLSTKGKSKKATSFKAPSDKYAKVKVKRVKDSKNPNLLDYPPELIYKAVKHPSVY